MDSHQTVLLIRKRVRQLKEQVSQYLVTAIRQAEGNEELSETLRKLECNFDKLKKYLK
jgi:hypothetical protein